MPLSPSPHSPFVVFASSLSPPVSSSILPPFLNFWFFPFLHSIILFSSTSFRSSIHFFPVFVVIILSFSYSHCFIRSYSHYFPVHLAQYGGEMSELDDAGTYFDLGPRSVTGTGTYHYMSSRNNNFSNRSQKGRIVLSDTALYTSKIGVNGGTIRFRES